MAKTVSSLKAPLVHDDEVETLLEFAVGLLVSFATWVSVIVLSKPRLGWSDSIVHRRDDLGRTRFEVKLVNRMPWRCLGLTVDAYLICPGVPNKRVIVSVPVSESSSPLLGGYLLARRRRALYGWLGSSHRIVTLWLNDLQDVDRRRIDPSVLEKLSQDPVEWLRAVLHNDSELVLVATAADGLLFGQARSNLKLYHGDCLVAGRFATGRRTDAVMTGPPPADGGSVSQG